MHRLFEGWVNSLKFGTIALVIVAVVFSALEQNFPFHRLKKPWKCTLLDLQYFFAGLFYPPVVSFALSAFFAFFMIRRDKPPATISSLGFTVEFLAVLFANDVLAYIRHRIFHSKDFWAFHSIHHSSEQVNWSSGPKLHPAESIADVLLESLVFAFGALMGGNPKVFVAAGIVIGAWNFFIHSNTRWTLGPLRYVLVSPVQHRWHHSDTRDAMDKNFAVMFSCIDVALGTFYMPRNAVPKTTGLMGDERKTHPRTFIGQFLYPFRREHTVNSQSRLLSPTESQD